MRPYSFTTEVDVDIDVDEILGYVKDNEDWFMDRLSHNYSYFEDTIKSYKEYLQNTLDSYDAIRKYRDRDGIVDKEKVLEEAIKLYEDILIFKNNINLD